MYVEGPESYGSHRYDILTFPLIQKVARNVESYAERDLLKFSDL